MSVVHAGERISDRIFHSRLNPCDAVTAVHVPNLPFIASRAPVAGDMTITFAPLQHGIVRIGFDRQQLTARPFDTLHLRIAGTVLVIKGAKGRYER